MVGAVVGAEKFIGANRTWTAVNASQKRFLKDHFGPCRGEVRELRELETLASWNAEELSQFLAAKGFPSQLDPFKDGEFGVASVLDVLVEWLVAGTKVPIRANGTEYSGARLTKGVSYWSATGHKAPIAVLETKTAGTRVCLTALAKAPKDGFDLVLKAEKIAGSASVTGGFAAVQFPMVDLNQKVDISWLKEMHTRSDDGKDWTITQAKQRTKLRMNEKGARAQSAVEIGVRTTSIHLPKPDLIINKPFMIWFTRAGLKRPLFVGHITPEDWKEPADLTTA